MQLRKKLFFNFRPTETSHDICLEMQYSDTSLLKSQEREEQSIWHRRSTSLQKKGILGKSSDGKV